MEENHTGWKLFKGVRRDVTNLFKLFANTDSVRYEDFCIVWKQMNFSLIYSNRTSFIEWLEFTEELLQIVKEYLLSVYEFPTRIAALYTLYGLYFKQPLKDAAKIRFTKSEWEEVYSLIEKCKADKHYDIVFIHLKMYLSGAYYFSATIRPLGLERGFRKYSEKKCSLLPEHIDRELLTRPLICRESVNTLMLLESLYCKKKAELLGKRNLVFIDGTFAQNLKEELERYASENQKQQAMHAASEETNDNVETERNKSTKTKSKPGRSKMNLDKLRDEEDDDDEITLGPIIKRKKTYYMNLVAKRKAELYLKKIHEEQQPSTSHTTLDLPELDLD